MFSLHAEGLYPPGLSLATVGKSATHQLYTIKQSLLRKSCLEPTPCAVPPRGYAQATILPHIWMHHVCLRRRPTSTSRSSLDTLEGALLQLLPFTWQQLFTRLPCVSKAPVAGYKSQRKKSYEKGGHCFGFEKKDKKVVLFWGHFFFCLERRETRAVRWGEEAIFVLEEKEKRGSVPFSWIEKKRSN